MAARQTGRHRALRRTTTTAAVPGSGAPRPAGAVAVRPVASKRLPAALMAWPEAIGPAAGLADGEFRNGARGRGLSLSRQRRPNQRPMNRPLIVNAAFGLVFISLDFLDDPIVFRREGHLHFGVVRMLVMIERRVLDRLRTTTDVDVIVMLVGRGRRRRMRAISASARSRPPARTARPANLALRRWRGTLACLYSCSVSHVVQRVCFTSAPTIATTAWFVNRRSRVQ